MASAANAEPRPAYTVTARVLHWITAVVVLVHIPLGIGIGNFKLGYTLYNLHKSYGAVLFFMLVFGLIYRLARPPAPLPPDIPHVQRVAAETMHWTLYALLVIQGLAGWIGTSAYPAPIPVFGLFELP